MCGILCPKASRKPVHDSTGQCGGLLALHFPLAAAVAVGARPGEARRGEPRRAGGLAGRLFGFRAGASLGAL